MSEYSFIEKPFLDQLDALGWTVIDQVMAGGPGIPTDPTKSLRASFREVTLRDVFNHLFLDQDGIPTLVEVKRGSNAQVRREVVGQLEAENEHATTIGLEAAFVDFATHYPAAVIRYFDRIDRARGKNDGTTPFVAGDELP